MAERFEESVAGAVHAALLQLGFKVAGSAEFRGNAALARAHLGPSVYQYDAGARSLWARVVVSRVATAWVVFAQAVAVAGDSDDGSAMDADGLGPVHRMQARNPPTCAAVRGGTGLLRTPPAGESVPQAPQAPQAAAALDRWRERMRRRVAYHLLKDDLQVHHLEQANLPTLPNVAYCAVLAFLPLREVTRVLKTCGRTHAWGADEVLWRSLAQRDLALAPGGCTTKREYLDAMLENFRMIADQERRKRDLMARTRNLHPRLFD